MACFRRQLPRLVMDNSVAIRNAPGITITHHARVINAFSARDSILPKETTYSGSPMPRKLRVDSATMALRMFMTTIKRMDEKTLGVRCLRSK